MPMDQPALAASLQGLQANGNFFVTGPNWRRDRRAGTGRAGPALCGSTPAWRAACYVIAKRHETVAPNPDKEPRS
jgi:hypothetical protein